MLTTEKKTIKLITAFIFSALLLSANAHSQPNTAIPAIDITLANKITVSGFCLCQISLPDLEKLTNDLKPVDVEEMDLPKSFCGRDGSNA